MERPTEYGVTRRLSPTQSVCALWEGMFTAAMAAASQLAVKEIDPMNRVWFVKDNFAPQTTSWWISR